ncbi:TRAP transporter small permease subunit [Brevibacterium yomogidense]|uniref:TRAP transporter small permease subunit n=1 Tax=Brevibacterium yomogidense TaxID=946573 RepID=UPI0018DF9807|nr:TRAP transporter small permease [Brevibacterium yomogidense]
MTTLWSGIDRTAGWMSRLCGWGAVLLTLTVAALLVSNVVLRIVAQPIYGVVDYTKYGMLAIVMLALPYTHREHAHIAIRLVTDRFPPRARHGFELLAQLLTAGTTAYISYLYLARTLMGAKSFSGGLITLPEMPFRVLIIVGFGLWAVEALIDAVNAARRLAGSETAETDSPEIDPDDPLAADDSLVAGKGPAGLRDAVTDADHAGNSERGTRGQS